MGSRSTLFKLESSLVSDMVAASGPLLLLLWLLFKLSGPRDVMSGDEAAESFCDFFELLDVFEFDRAI